MTICLAQRQVKGESAKRRKSLLTFNLEFAIKIASSNDKGINI